MAILKEQSSHVEVIFADTLAYFNIDHNMETDPKIICDILANDMFLEGLEPLERLLGDLLSKPQSMGPMFDKLLSGLEDKHPATIEFMEAALNDKLYPEVNEHQNEIIRFVHHMMLLDQIVISLCQDPQMMNEIGEAFLKKREALGIKRTFWKSLWGVAKALNFALFEVAKSKTFDTVYEFYINIRKQDAVTPENIQWRRKSLQLNIIEAVVADWVKGKKNNVCAGVALFMNPIEDLRLKGENKVVEMIPPEGWTSLYSNWNTAFCIGYMNNLDTILPKLLVPSILCAESEDYLFNRGLGLWLTINFYLLQKMHKRPVKITPNSQVLALRYGEINARYAKDFTTKHNKFAVKGIGDLFFKKKLPEINNG